MTHADGSRTIVERFGVASSDDDEAPESPKVTLSAYLWERIAGAAAEEFNSRLRAAGLRAGTWNKPETVLAPHFGKELTLLAWAVESLDTDPTPIPAIIANWRGLAPEERWWFYTTINATSASADHGQDRGWRKAIKIAFSENPIDLPPSALLIGPMPQRPGRLSRVRGRAKHSATSTDPDHATQGRLRLWGTEDEER